MKIGIVLNPYGIEKPSGLSRFILNMTLEIIRQSPHDMFFIFIKGVTETADFHGIKNVEIKFMPDNFLWKDIAYIKNKNVDVWLYNNLGLPLIFTPPKSVAIALDFGNFYGFEKTSNKRFLEIKAQKFLQERALQVATKVVCISESTRNDIKRFFPQTPMNKVSVSMCGYTAPCEVFTAKGIDNLPKSFYLLVGVIKPRKNQMIAVKAFISAKERGLDSHLIITGKGNGEYYEKLMNLVENNHYKESIHYIGYRSDEEMVTLYKQARALIVPSRVEGFGMPVVEAMSCGTPVIISSHGSLVEVAGGAAIVCDLDSVDEFANAMIALSDESVRGTYIQKGLVQSKKFSWHQSAKEYLKVLHNFV